MIEIDGSQGEGGGQMLRTSLTLAMITGRPFRIVNIRGGRPKPGLLRQHLACVRAAAEICAAAVEGAELGSLTLTFAPGQVRPGNYEWSIGSAGSTGLVLQTVFLPLALAAQKSRLVLRGGTHNTNAPPFEFLNEAWLPLLRKIGFNARLTLDRHGFYPAGGGQMTAEIEPPGLVAPMTLESAGESYASSADILISQISGGVAEREAKVMRMRLGWPEAAVRIRGRTHSDGPGNIIIARLPHEYVTEIFSSVGSFSISAEAVAETLARAVLDYRATGAPVGEHLADQLLLPMALAGGGYFVTSDLTQHSLTNIDVIKRFLEASISCTQLGRMLWRVETPRVESVTNV
jgi:RNA 3'-terminal phosphate cyclase (ATP)